MSPSARHRAVLVLDGTPRSVVTICRALDRSGIPALCASLGPVGLGLRSKSVVADLALTTDESAFFEQLTRLLSRYDVDTIFPCSDLALAMLLPHYAELKRLASLSCPAPDVVRRVLHKNETLAAAKRCSINVPATHIVRAGDTLADVMEAVRLPLIAKPYDAGRSNPFKVKYLDTVEDVATFLEGPQTASRIVLQEFFAGDGVGVSTIVAGGKPLTLFQHRRLHEYPPGGGAGVLFESEAVEPELARAAASLLAELAWEGPAMVEFRQNAATRDYVLMEVNGRFWGSLSLAVHCGVDFPLMQWQVCRGFDPEVPRQYDAGVRERWTAGELQRFADLVTSPSTRKRLGLHWTTPIVQLVRSFHPAIRSALFSKRDPLPELNDVFFTTIRVVASKAWHFALRLLPEPASMRLLQLRRLSPQSRKTYVSLWISRIWSFHRTGDDRQHKSARKLTLVCRANRIRSPLAAALLASAVERFGKEHFEIRSAGTQTVPDGAFDARARAAAEALGLRLNGRPQGLTPELVSASDVLVVMDRVIEAELLTQFPQAAPKICFLKDIGGYGSAQEIPDPDTVTKEEFSRFVSALTTSIQHVARVLCQ